MTNREEYILCAAIWYKDFPKPAHSVINCDRGVVLCGYSHAHIIHQHVILMKKRSAEMGEYEQGFLTSKNRFVGREESLIIALRENQVLDLKEIRGNRLFSEDLY